MWTVLFLLTLGAVHCSVSSSPPSPLNVTFSSVDLRNELRWLPGSGTPNGTLFKVEYAIYGDSVEGSRGRKNNWRPVKRCTKIEQSWCDLSNETWDPEQGYHARVRALNRRAVSAWAYTRWRFDPKTDTSFGPPLVSVKLEDNNAIVTLKGPMRYQPDSHSPAISMSTLYPQMTYNLFIEHQGTTLRVPVRSSSYTYRLMEYNTKYCFSAEIRFLSMPARCRASEPHCITTPQDPMIGQLQTVVVGIVVSSVCTCMVVVVSYFLYRYLTGKGQKSPYILHPPTFHPPVLTFPPEKPNLIVIAIIKEMQPEGDKPDPASQELPRHPPGYASQRPETPPEPEDSWDDQSVDYGFVGVAPETAYRGEGGNHRKGEDRKNLYEKKEWGVKDGRSAGHTRTEMSTLTQAQAWLLSQAPLLATMQEEDGEEEEEEEEGEGEFPGLFISTSPQTGLFRFPLNRPSLEGELDGGLEDRSENENLPLLSSYARQHTTTTTSTTTTSHYDQSDCLPDDYGILGHKINEDDYEEEGNICIDWNPKTGKLVLPLINGLMQGEKEEEEEEEEEEEIELRLENVFVRQGSEEKAEAQRAIEGGGGTGWESDDFLTRWNLIISMDQ